MSTLSEKARNYPLLITGISPAEFRQIKDCEACLIKGLAKDKSIKISVRYNSERESAGIFVSKGTDEPRLILYEGDACSAEYGDLVKRVHKSLLTKLDEVRIRREDWID